MTPAIGTIVNVGVLADGGDDGDPSDAVAAIAEALDVVRAAAGEACRLVPELGGEPAVRLWTTLDAGLDRRAAEAALARGMRLSVVLAGTRAPSDGTTGPGPEAERAAVLDRAESVLELCAHGEAARAQAETLVLGQADVLVVAAPPGLEHARPGTLLIANAAVEASVPLLLVGPDGSGAHEVVWRGWMPHPHPMSDVLDAPRRTGPAALSDAVRSLLRPPPGASRLREFLTEPLDATWRRPEYGLFVRLIGPARSRAMPDAGREAPTAPEPVDDVLGAIEARAERLGSAHGSSYRSQFVTRFALVALLSVSLNGLWAVAPKAEAAFAGIQAAIIGLVLFDSRIARRKRWHERWLEYRYLRERLRTVRFLHRVGAPLPDLGSAAGAPRDSWMDWLATRLARSVGVASARFDAARVRALADALDRDDLGGQLDYHARASEVLNTIARRLGRSSRALFIVSLALAVALAFGGGRMVAAVCPVSISAEVSTTLSTLPFLLPPVALALEGIASRGDFERLVQRSESTGAALAAIRAELREPGLGFGRLFALSWHLAAAMAADVAEWRFVFEARH